MQDESDIHSSKVPKIPAWDPVVPSNQIRLLNGLYTRLRILPDGMIEDEKQPKTKEAKLMIKYAIAGGRKKALASAPKKKAMTVDPVKAAAQAAKKLAMRKDRSNKKKKLTGTAKE